ncbi:MerR family DNA-binding protein [Pseudonocardia sp. KRD-291]|nr:MerR family DNA-binding protein [Pseudonocardia sp. KRD291]
MGQAGRAAGVTRKAIRVYEQRGLLSPTGRTAAGYRMFSDGDVDTLRFIRRARTLGLGLDDVGEVLDEHRGGGSPCSSVRVRLDQRITEIDQAMAELSQLRVSLVEATTRCQPAGVEEKICPIIEAEPTEPAVPDDVPGEHPRTRHDLSPVKTDGVSGDSV